MVYVIVGDPVYRIALLIYKKEALSLGQVVMTIYPAPVYYMVRPFGSVVFHLPFLQTLDE